MKDIYYIAPDDASFNDMKQAAETVWRSMDNTYGYVDEKLNRIKDIQNISDNFMYLLGMFDTDNQLKVISLLNDVTKAGLRARMISGGNDEHYCDLLGL